MIDVVLDGSYADFRRAVRPLLGHRVAPSRVQFRVRDVDPPGLFGGARPPVDGPPVSLPRRFVGLAGRATCFDAPDRYALAYRVAFRLLSDRTLLDDPGDDDVLALTRRAKHVARDVHKMHAFVRFRRVSRDGVPWWVAFHRPDHFVVARAVDHFVDRFGNDRFAILTPKGSASYTPPDGLTLGPPATDPGIDLGRFEQLWDTYYASIFNPARPMVEAMLAEMPRKHWATMPETRQIPRLLREARERVRASGERAGAGITLPDGLSLSDLAERVRGCDACPLADSGRPGVPGEGPVDAASALVGEQPGDLEDQVGRPFVGPAGQLLDRALAAAGLERDALYLTNTVKHFRFEAHDGRRLHASPERYHVEVCKVFVFTELARLAPRVTVALGTTAARALLGQVVPLRQLRGQVLRSRVGPLVVGPHPSALLRRPELGEDWLVDTLRLAAEVASGARAGPSAARRHQGVDQRENRLGGLFGDQLLGGERRP
jgi:DNA polymerase